MMVALQEFSGGVKLRRFMACADAGVGAVEMAMVVARGAVAAGGALRWLLCEEEELAVVSR